MLSFIGNNLFLIVPSYLTVFLLFFGVMLTNALARKISALKPLLRQIDLNIKLSDKRRLIGEHKPIAGWIMPAIAAAASYYFFRDFSLMLAICYSSFFGDLLGSFLKRRLNIPEHSSLMPVDQLSFFVTAYAAAALLGAEIPISELAPLLATTFVLHIAGNLALHRVKLKAAPFGTGMLSIASIAVALLVIAGSVASEARQNTNANKQQKILIIFAEALPYYIVERNLNSLPNLKELCSEGACFSMKPVAPTFTTMEMHAIRTGKKPSEANFAYNFIINETALKLNTCAFIGEMTDLSRAGQYNLFMELGKSFKFRTYSKVSGEERYADENFPILPKLLSENDIIYTYVTDTDSHFTNLTYTDSTSQIVQKFNEFDKKLGELVSQLKEQNLYDRTSIVLFGDHGMAQIEKFEYLPELMKEVGKQTDTSSMCYWNDAGTSLRFWALPNATNAAQAKEAITTYFAEKTDCFYVVNDAVLEQEGLLMTEPRGRWLSFGDVFIAVRPECKVNTQKASGGMENGFEVKQGKVDRYISMHGYIDSSHPELQAFVAVRTPAGKPAIKENFTVTDLHNLIKSLAWGEK